MQPTLKAGRLVIGLAYLKPKPGKLIIARFKGRDIIKRLAAVKGDQIYIVGDNQAESSDSRNFGWLNKNSLLATVIWPFKK